MTKALSFFLILLIVLANISGNVFAGKPAQTGAAANTPRSLQLKGLKAPVTVRRDDRGIPYIQAENEDDLILAQGYVTASDRLWQMDLLRRTIRGELAEIFGQAALAQDKQHRIFGYGMVADRQAEKLPPQLKAVYENYARGVNAYIDSCDDKTLPVEFRLLKYRPTRWKVSDSLAVGKVFAESLSTTWPLDISRAAFKSIPEELYSFLLPDRSPLDVLVVGEDQKTKRVASTVENDAGKIDLKNAPEALAKLNEAMETQRAALERVGVYAEDLAASNNWVVSGKRSVTQSPLLANDPHLQPTAPSIWYMTWLFCPTLNVAGVTTAGIPGIILGHNNSIAWGATNLGPDVQDLYLETFDTTNPQKYKTPAGLRDADVRMEEIRVRNGFNDPTTKSEFVDITVTRHGPIVFEQNGQKYALKWSVLDPTANEGDGLFKLNHAQNWDEFRAALSLYGGATQNFVYADKFGHIGYYGAGRIPIRKKGIGDVPYDGSTDDGEWTGFIPFEKLPHVFDPPSGMIVTANSRVIGDSYDMFLTNGWASPYRSRRIYDLLSAKPTLSVDDFRAVQGDVYTIGGHNFAKALVKICKPDAQSTDDPKWQETLKQFEAWDGKVTADSRVAPLLSETRRAFLRRILIAKIGQTLANQYRWPNADTVVDALIADQPAKYLPGEFKTYAALLQASYRDAVSALSTRFGADETQWTWAKYNPPRFPHPLADAPLIGGQFKIAEFPQSGNGGFGVGATPNVGVNVSMRFIGDTSNWDNSRHGFALGESGDPTSPHWKDQLDDWKSVNPRAFPFSADAVKKATREDLVLKPQ